MHSRLLRASSLPLPGLIAIALFFFPGISAWAQNANPILASAHPAKIPAGLTTTVTLHGSGFLPSSTVCVNELNVKSTYNSPTSITVEIPVPAKAAGIWPVRVYNHGPGAGSSAPLQEAIVAPVSVAAAARILDQTTFGPTSGLISLVQQEGVNAWLVDQLNTPPTLLPNISDAWPASCVAAVYCAESEWWKVALTGNDQLRQRVAFALNEIFVISDGAVHDTAISPYANMLSRDAFGNWYKLMKDVTLSPAMGYYLNMTNSARATGSQIANENYARENLQLFNLGLNLLNQDGTLQLDPNGNPIPVYTEPQVEAFARAYTGWTFANADGSAPTRFNTVWNWFYPMVPVESQHDTTAKVLLNGTVLPAGQTAEQDIAGALANIFEHPNLPPFISRQLIQHLVTGDPSPGYVSRVAAVFIDDGNHIRGNMRAVVTAILTDPEARAADTNVEAESGHLREPILWMTGMLRGIGYVNSYPDGRFIPLTRASFDLNERPYDSPSVFNFFPPGYVIPGTPLNEPEFALENTGSIGLRRSMADRLLTNQIDGFTFDLGASSPLGLLAANPAKLVDSLGVIFLHGQMSANMRTTIIDEVASLSDPAQRARIAAYLVVTSSEYKILH